MGVGMMANKNTLFVMLVVCATLFQAHCNPFFFPNSTDSLHLQHAQVPKSPDLANFVSTTKPMAMTTEPIVLSLAHVCWETMQTVHFTPRWAKH